MAGFANMITPVVSSNWAETGGRQVVDMTGIQGQLRCIGRTLSLAELIAMARAAGADIPAGPPGGGGAGGAGNAPAVASDPSGGRLVPSGCGCNRWD